MDYREFIQVRQRKGGLDGDLAGRAARATQYAGTVFAESREAVRNDEYFDATVQLPMGYHALLPEP